MENRSRNAVILSEANNLCRRSVYQLTTAGILRFAQNDNRGWGLNPQSNGSLARWLNDSMIQ